MSYALIAAAPALHRTAADRRADDGRRAVTLAPASVLVERQVSGVKMRVLVPTSAYVGLVLARRAAPSTAYAIVLSHPDADLCVEIDAAEDLAVLTSRLQAWAAFFGRPVIDGGEVPAPVLQAGPALPRRRTVGTRRRLGQLTRLGIIHRGEDEIIAAE